MKTAVRDRAARLYSLAMVAHLDGGDTHAQTVVISRARAEARRALAAEGYAPNNLLSLDDCIRAARAEMEKRTDAPAGPPLQ